MSHFAVCDKFLARCDGEPTYLLDVLFKIIQDNPHKVLADEEGLVLEKYRAIALSSRDIATWLKLVAMRPSLNFEFLPISGASPPDLYLALVAGFGNGARLICWSKHDYAGAATCGPRPILDRDEARHELNRSEGGAPVTNIFANNSTVINESDVRDSFNKVSQSVSPDAANLIAEVAKIVQAMGDRNAQELFESFISEVNQPKPKKSVLTSLWDGLTRTAEGGEKLIGFSEKMLQIINAF